MNKLYEGKAKIVYLGPQEATYRVYFKDDATAFNAQKRGTILGKGAINNQISATLFKLLEAKGVPTHFLQLLSEREMLVRQVQIVPLEVIVRNRAAGTFCKRYGVEEGTRLTQPLLEFSLKNDALGDPLIYPDAAIALGVTTQAEVERIAELARLINHHLTTFFLVRGLEVVDFKLEFGRLTGVGKPGALVLADEISPDTMRLWEIGSGHKMDKDRFRRDLGGVEEAYVEVLRRVQEDV